VPAPDVVVDARGDVRGRGGSRVSPLVDGDSNVDRCRSEWGEGGVVDDARLVV
jgi:hypothetical protein